MSREKEFLSLMMRNQKDLSVFISSMVWDRGACEDILQDLALALWQNFESYDPKRPFCAWARGVCLNIVRSYYSRKKRESAVFSEEARAAIARAYEETPPVDHRREEALRDCMHDLPPASRGLLKLRYEQSLSLSELGKRLQKSSAAVNMHLTRLRSRLLECVEGKLLAEKQP